VHAAEDGTLEDRLVAGIRRAEQAIDSGSAQDVLTRWIAAAGQKDG
jgi:anthranilate phosphoribosyltransferase